jgi:hypothetical protein
MVILSASATGSFVAQCGGNFMIIYQPNGLEFEARQIRSAA